MRQTVNNRGHKVLTANRSSAERLYGIEHKEKRNNARQKRMKDPEYRRRSNDMRNIATKKRYEQLRQSLMKILGGAVCIKCGFNDSRVLQFEHIHNDGYVDKKRFNRYDLMMRFYIENPIRARETLQVYCSNCNQIKVVESKHA